MSTANNTDLHLYPFPKKLEFREGGLLPGPNVDIRAADLDAVSLHRVTAALQEALSEATGTGATSRTALSFSRSSSLPAEGYALSVREDGIRIRYGSPAGAYYAVKTLRQLVRQENRTIPCLEMEDAPDFRVRGALFDIGRDKIPTMETLFALVDLLSDFKYNQLQLYMEGYCFEFAEYRQDFPGETPLTGAEIHALDRYAREHFIDLVPVQNGFGHMAPWLDLKRLRHLAENEGGLSLAPGVAMPPSTLNPLDPGSAALVEGLLGGLLPHFSSPYANICQDEPFELGTGKSAAACAARGKGRIYLDFVRQVCGVVRRLGKTPMAWGDVLTHYSELLPELPEDLIVLDWNYDGATSFEVHARMLQQGGKHFFLCPGTSSWGSIGGRTENMKSNILDAVRWGKCCGAEGLLLTDWGDGGHWQCLPVSYPGVAWFGTLAWNTEGGRGIDLADCLDRFVFGDKTGHMGKALLTLGDIPRCEGIAYPNNTLMFLTLTMFGLCNSAGFERWMAGFAAAVKRLSDVTVPAGPCHAYNFDELEGLLACAENGFAQAQMRAPDAALVCEELRQTVLLLRHGAHLVRWDLCAEGLSAGERARLLDTLRGEIAEVLELYPRVFLRRFRPGGLARSTKRLYELQRQYDAVTLSESGHTGAGSEA